MRNTFCSLATTARLFAVIGLLVLLSAHPSHAQSSEGGLPELMERVVALEAKATTAHAEVAALKAKVGNLEAKVSALQTALAAQDKVVRYFTADSSNNIYISGANLHIVNGTGETATANGLGNLVVGYNEQRTYGANERTGSHNVVVGARHNYSRFGGLVVGSDNTVSADWASVAGGLGNTASGHYASVTGGLGNTASGRWSSVTGGQWNTASGWVSSVTGGDANTASGFVASVTGGEANQATADFASVTGGYGNIASAWSASVSGGQGNQARNAAASVSGGLNNQAQGDKSSVSGGVGRAISWGAPTGTWRAGDITLAP